MARAAEKIAISIDGGLLARAERVRRATGESRSALIGRALRHLLSSDEHALEVARYVDGYRTRPEEARNVEDARVLARRTLAALPWDDR